MLLTQRSLGLIPGVPKKLYRWRCLEERLKNVGRTHLVLASGNNYYNNSDPMRNTGLCNYKSVITVQMLFLVFFSAFAFHVLVASKAHSPVKSRN